MKAEAEAEKINLLQQLKDDAIKTEEYEILTKAANEESQKHQKEAEKVQHVVDRLQAEMLESQRREDEQKNELMKIISTPPAVMSIAGGTSGSLTTIELEEESTSHQGSDLECHEVVIQKEFEYSSQADKNARLKQQLMELSKELSKARDDTRRTTEDILHEGNLKEGRDKYKTLRQVRSGNTKQRVDEFEAL